MSATTTPLDALYLEDETAWLETMADILRRRKVDELDWHNLSEYLTDMARRDRREVYSRLVVLLTHRLKWDHQPDKRTASWRGTLMAQRRELRLLLESGTLRNHAAAALEDAYREARDQAAVETEMATETFPVDCGVSIDELLAREET